MIKGYSLKNLFLRILSEFQFPQTYYGKKIRYKLVAKLLRSIFEKRFSKF